MPYSSREVRCLGEGLMSDERSRVEDRIQTRINGGQESTDMTKM